METHTYFYDEKVMIWSRNYFTVEAENKEEADQKAIELIAEKDVNWDFEIEQVEYLEETEERITPEENNNSSTLELFSPEGDLLYKNGE